MGYDERRAMTGLALKWTHLVIAVAVYLVSMGAVYATVRVELDETQTQLRELQQQTIKDAQFKEFKEDIQRRLQRIEDKLDRERSMRGLN